MISMTTFLVVTFMETAMPPLPALYDHLPDLPKRIDVELRVRIRR